MHDSDLDPHTSIDPSRNWRSEHCDYQSSIFAARQRIQHQHSSSIVSDVSKASCACASADEASTICIALNGLAPWIWIPLANKYGRRPIYIASTLLGFASALGCAYTKTYGQLLVARVFNGFFPAGFALAAATVTDLFFYHQRGRAVGFYTITMTTGSHLAPIVGGLIAQFCGWRWIFKFLAIIDAVMVIVTFFCLPETLYIRPRQPTDSKQTLSPTPPRFTKDIYRRKMSLYHPQAAVHLRPTQFILSSLKMARYPSVIFPALCKLSHPTVSPHLLITYHQTTPQCTASPPSSPPLPWPAFSPNSSTGNPSKSDWPTAAPSPSVVS